MILGAVEEHSTVLVRARVLWSWDDACELALPELRGEMLGTFSFEPLYRPPSVADASRAILIALELHRRFGSEMEGMLHQAAAEIRQMGDCSLEQGVDVDSLWARIKANIAARQS